MHSQTVLTHNQSAQFDEFVYDIVVYTFTYDEILFFTYEILFFTLYEIVFFTLYEIFLHTKFKVLRSIFKVLGTKFKDFAFLY